MRENRFAYLLIIVILFIHNVDYIIFSIYSHWDLYLVFVTNL